MAKFTSYHVTYHFQLAHECDFTVPEQTLCDGERVPRDAQAASSHLRRNGEFPLEALQEGLGVHLTLSCGVLRG